MSRYVIFSARFAPFVGGVETYTANLAKSLAQAGHQVDIITCRLTDDDAHEVLGEGINLYRVPAGAPFGPRLPLSYLNKEAHTFYTNLAKNNIDYVIVNTRFYRLSRHGLQFARQVQAPALVLDHGSDYLTIGNPFGDSFIHTYEHAVTSDVKHYHPRFAGISKASVKWLEKFGIHTDLVVPNAIDAQAFRNQSSKRDFRNEFNVGPDEHMYVAIGRLCPEKGAHRLIDLVRANPKGRFFWAGEGPQRYTIESSGVKNVHLLGNMSRPDIAALLDQADAFFLPTRSEGFCTSLLEAGSMGVPAVMPHVGGVDEVMGNPVKFGAVCDVDDIEGFRRAMYEVAEQSRNNPQVKEDIKKHVEQTCSWNNTLESLYRAFEN